MSTSSLFTITFCTAYMSFPPPIVQLFDQPRLLAGEMKVPGFSKARFDYYEQQIDILLNEAKKFMQKPDDPSQLDLLDSIRKEMRERYSLLRFVNGIEYYGN